MSEKKIDPRHWIGDVPKDNTTWDRTTWDRTFAGAYVWDMNNSFRHDGPVSIGTNGNEIYHFGSRNNFVCIEPNGSVHPINMD